MQVAVFPHITGLHNRNGRPARKADEQRASDLPALEGQIHILVIEDDFMQVRSLLARCTDAGMHTRYAPPNAAFEAIRFLEPHLIVLGATSPETECLRLVAFLRSKTAVPFLVLTETQTNRSHWQELLPDPLSYIPKNSPAQTIFRCITARLRAVYHEDQLMVSETPDETTLAGVPAGWGKCQSCEYVGPRANFVNPDRLSRHSLICPACKRTNDVEFAVG